VHWEVCCLRLLTSGLCPLPNAGAKVGVSFDSPKSFEEKTRYVGAVKGQNRKFFVKV